MPCRAPNHTAAQANGRRVRPRRPVHALGLKLAPSAKELTGEGVAAATARRSGGGANDARLSTLFPCSLTATPTFARPLIRAVIGMMRRALIRRFAVFLPSSWLFNEKGGVEQPSNHLRLSNPAHEDRVNNLGSVDRRFGRHDPRSVEGGHAEHG